MTTTYRPRVLLVLALGALAMLVGIRPAEAAYPGTNGEIAFHSDRDVAAGEIYAISPTGGTADRITFTDGSKDPAWSPDGSKIVYTNGTSDADVWTMNAATGVGPNVLLAVENLTGSGGADQLRGWAVANLLVGGAGADDLFGLGGADTLNGGAGTDSCIKDATEATSTSCP